MIWNAQDMIAATSATLHGDADWRITGMALDNRKTNPGDLFIALKGENHDGHDYVAAAADAGAVAALVSRKVDAPIPQLVAGDSLMALRDLAKASRQRSSATVVAITGSVGKTGTKQIISTCLQSLGKTHASAGNFNNHIGAPLSLALMPQDSAYGVFELGMNHSGEIAALSPMVAPDIAVITRISNSHGGFFDSLDDIAAAKAEIFLGLKPGGVAVLNADDPYCAMLAQSARDHGASRVITCGYAAEADARIQDVKRHPNGLAISAEINGKPIDVTIKMAAPHWALSVVMGLAIVDHLGKDIHAVDLTPLHDLAGRGERHAIAFDDGRAFTLIDDSYNASPASMSAALTSLGSDPTLGRRVAILADMLELGEAADDLHRDLVDAVAAADLGVLIGIGPLMKNLIDAAQDACPKTDIHHCADAKAASDLALTLISDGDLVLVKGSNGMKTSSVVTRLLAAASAPQTQNGGHHAA